jgi:hypothetical protein
MKVPWLQKIATPHALEIRECLGAWCATSHGRRILLCPQLDFQVWACIANSTLSITISTHLLGALYSQSHVPVTIADHNEGLHQHQTLSTALASAVQHKHCPQSLR